MNFVPAKQVVLRHIPALWRGHAAQGLVKPHERGHAHNCARLPGQESSEGASQASFLVPRLFRPSSALPHAFPARTHTSVLGIMYVHCCGSSYLLTQAAMTELQAAGSPEGQGAAALRQLPSADGSARTACRSSGHPRMRRFLEARLEEADARRSSFEKQARQIAQSTKELRRSTSSDLQRCGTRAWAVSCGWHGRKQMLGSNVGGQGVIVHWTL